jgi:putative glycosyltransferase
MKIELSVVATLYQSAEYLDEFYQRTVSACKQFTEHFEIILVNDGSPDDSLQKAIELYQEDQRVRVIDLSRNFGHHKAIMTGLSYAKGDRVFLIDSDLEESPELLLSFHQEMEANQTLDMVYGVQKKRKGKLFERVSGRLFYKVVNALGNTAIPANFLTVRLMNRRFVEQLCKYQEREFTFSTLISLNGFHSKSIFIEKGHKGESAYTLRKKMTILVNTITSSSAKPLWIIFTLGTMITILSACAITYVFFKKLIDNIEVEGWTSLMMSIWFIGGVLMLSVGVIGIYLSKVFLEVKQRPYVNIRQIIEHQNHQQNE